MKRVRQRDPTGCGLACIAMLSGDKYESVKDVAINELGWEESGTFYTGTRDLRELGRYFGIELGKRRRLFKNFNALPDTAILAINYKEQTDTWHWCLYRRIKDDQFVNDPSQSIKTNKRRDFGRMKVKWFLPIRDCRDSYKTQERRKKHNDQCF